MSCRSEKKISTAEENIGIGLLPSPLANNQIFFAVVQRNQGAIVAGQFEQHVVTPFINDRYMTRRVDWYQAFE
jgi:inner membrane protein involved in colicin E2 resistance